MNLEKGDSPLCLLFRLGKRGKFRLTPFWPPVAAASVRQQKSRRDCFIGDRLAADHEEVIVDRKTSVKTFLS
jgi:hypothetical protein